MNSSSVVRMCNTDYRLDASRSCRFKVTWNSENVILAANGLQTAVLTLHADSSITNITNFNINIIITGTQVA